MTEPLRVVPTTVIVEPVTADTLPVARAKSPKPPLQVPLTGLVMTMVEAVKLVIRGRGLADGAGVLGAADPDEGLRAAIALTHVPTATAPLVVAVVAVNAVFGPNVTVTCPD